MTAIEASSRDARGSARKSSRVDCPESRPTISYYPHGVGRGELRIRELKPQWAVYTQIIVGSTGFAVLSLSQPVDLLTGATLRCRRVGAFVVVEEGLEVFPPAPVQREERVDFGVGERGRPGPPQVMSGEVEPALVAGLLGQLLASVLDPPPERPRGVDGDDGLVFASVPILGGGADRRREPRGHRRLPVLVALALPDAQHRSGVGVDDVTRPHVEVLLRAEAAAHSEFERDALLGGVGGVDELVGLALGEPDLVVLSVLVFSKIHPYVRLSRYRDKNATQNRSTGGDRGVDGVDSVRLFATSRTEDFRLQWVPEAVKIGTPQFISTDWVAKQLISSYYVLTKTKSRYLYG